MKKIKTVLRVAQVRQLAASELLAIRGGELAIRGGELLAIGGGRDYQKEPGTIEFPNIKITFSEE